ncbi:tetratricopeptide repeat protein [Chryseobacterium kwangjuense]|uniref:tetratricopeptide repeat protein n=1 Tax=Chryseobacterium kwangjuense TaxID=267125 RepID=UPI000A5C8B30|nr:tetratricopeptide repeat protein [Chryseobacterium kwangjuense]
MIRCFIFVLLFFLTSCSKDFHNQYEKDFDSPLLTQNEKLRLSGDYNALVRLNKIYYEKANKLGYNEGKALCYMNLANVDISLENYPRAQVLFNKADKILQNSKSNAHRAKFCADYGFFQFVLKRRDQAFQYNRLGLEYIKGVPKSPFQNDILFKIYSTRADYFYWKKEYFPAIEYFRMAGKLDSTGRIDCAIGDVYLYGLKEMDSARIYLSRIAEKSNREGRVDGVALNANTVLGEYYMINHQYPEAEKYFNKALEINDKTKFIFAQYTKYIYTDLKSLYEQMGNKEKALFYLQAYTHEKNKSDTALFKAINNDVEKFISDIEKDSRDHRKRILLFCSAAVVLLFLLGIYVWNISTRLKQKKKLLRDEAEKLKNQIHDTSQEKVIELAKKNDPSFLQIFKKAYPGFIEKVLEINPDLENADLVFCAMLKLHFTSKEIAGYTFVQPRSVQQKKYRLRKKLNIPTETDIYQFFDNFT